MASASLLMLCGATLFAWKTYESLSEHNAVIARKEALDCHYAMRFRSLHSIQSGKFARSSDEFVVAMCDLEGEMLLEGYNRGEIYAFHRDAMEAQTKIDEDKFIASLNSKVAENRNTN